MSGFFITSIPGRSSDCGPDTPERPLKWHDHLDDAAEEVYQAIRLHRDDLAVQKKLRLEHINAAMGALQEAKAKIEADHA